MKLPNVFFLLITLLLFLIIPPFLPISVFALEENFDASPLDNTIWQVYQNEGLLHIDEGVLALSAGNTITFPYIHLQTNPIPLSGDFSVKLRMKYNSATTKGTGLILATETPPNGISDPSPNDPVFSRQYFLGVWQDSINGFFFQYTGNYYNQGCSFDQVRAWQKGTQDLDYHIIEFQYITNRYSISLDGINIFTSNPTEVRPITVWFGNPTVQGPGHTWTSFEIDYININPLPIPTPTPIPAPSPDPIILLPGLGASWNHEAMILGIHKDPEDWYMTPFVKAYDGLIQTLKNAGYEDTGPDRKLFIFNYDWRQSIETTANQLRDYIENTVDPPPETKIDLIGHSLGGMVARIYVQNNPNHQIDQLLTIGSPHRGASQVYYLWEGADLNRALFPAWQRIGAGILLQLNKRGFKNNVETIQHAVPALRDLLPTFPYLKQNGMEKPFSEMNQRNEWLKNLNLPPLPEFLISVLNNIVGLKGDTLRWINIEPRDKLDRLLGRWIDGKPIGEEFEMGDLKVLAESAQLEGANVIELSDLDHGELVETTDGQQAIISLLELSPSGIIPAPLTSYEPSLVFQLASPATMTVFGPDGWQIGEGVMNNIPDAIYSPNDKLIIIPHPKEGEYQTQVNEEDNGGDFRLLIGKLLPNFDIWQEFEGETTEEPQTFIAVFSEDPSQNKLELLKLAKQRLGLMRKKVLKSRKPFNFFLASTIRWRVIQINRAIRFLQREKENRAQTEIKAAIFSLIFFEKNLKFWAKLCRFSPEFQQELQENIRITKDYLLQVYEFE